jgi:hypothetical protein
MKQLRKRIIRLLKSREIKTGDEREKLEYLLNTKRWNPYCIRHSAITADSDYLPEYALKKKVRWSMNSKQGTRYIKRRMGNDLKQKILCYNGIVLEDALRPKPSVLECSRCQFINETENKFCSKCSYPLVPAAFEEIKASEQTTITELKIKYDDDINNMKQVIANLVTSVGNCNKSEKQEIAEQLIRSGFYNTTDKLKSSPKDDE